MTNKEFYRPSYWSKAWEHHLEKYLAAPPRSGIWVKSKFPNTYSVMECAGGSCRDSYYLHNNGFNSTGTDFDETTLKYIEKKNRNSKFILSKQDATKFSYNDNAYDIVFHNGFWVCFDEDEKIAALLKEQRRVSKKFCIAIVHNGHNTNLVESFKEKAKSDSLFNIRFFLKEDLLRILQLSNIEYDSFRLEKFGGPVDRLYSLGKRIRLLSPVVEWLAPRLYKWQPWSKVERIAFTIELK